MLVSLFFLFIVYVSICGMTVYMYETIYQLHKSLLYNYELAYFFWYRFSKTPDTLYRWIQIGFLSIPWSTTSSEWKSLILFNPLSPNDALQHHFIPEHRLTFPTTKGFRMKLSMKLVYQYVAIFFNFHPLQIIFIHYKSRIATAIRGL